MAAPPPPSEGPGPRSWAAGEQPSEGEAGAQGGCGITVRPSQLSGRHRPPGQALLPPLGLPDPGTWGGRGRRESSRPPERLTHQGRLATLVSVCRSLGAGAPSRWMAATLSDRWVSGRAAQHGGAAGPPPPALRVCGASGSTRTTAHRRPGPSTIPTASGWAARTGSLSRPAPTHFPRFLDGPCSLN